MDFSFFETVSWSLNRFWSSDVHLRTRTAYTPYTESRTKCVRDLSLRIRVRRRKIIIYYCREAAKIFYCFVFVLKIFKHPLNCSLILEVINICPGRSNEFAPMGIKSTYEHEVH